MPIHIEEGIDRAIENNGTNYDDIVEVGTGQLNIPAER